MEIAVFSCKSKQGLNDFSSIEKHARMIASVAGLADLKLLLASRSSTNQMVRGPVCSLSDKLQIPPATAHKSYCCECVVIIECDLNEQI